jgi:hypothetical protein
MKTATYANNEQQVKISKDSPMYMEAYERTHIEQVYQSARDPLLCWGEQSNYMDSEFLNALEGKDQGSYFF